MLVIERVSWRQRGYAVRDDAGHEGRWTGRRFGEAMTGEIDGNTLELRRDGRLRFTLMSSDTLLATAERPRRMPWRITADGFVYQLRPPSRWRLNMELHRGGIVVGSVRKAAAGRGRVICDLPAELSPAIQAFIGFVVLALWNRAVASSGSAVGVAAG